MFNKELLWEDISNAKSIGIAGHLRPDGDCMCGCIAMREYIKEHFAKEADMYIEAVPATLKVISGSENFITAYPYRKEAYDLFIVLDCGCAERMGKADRYFNKAKKTYCIDHHGSNEGYADENLIVGDAAAVCEVLYDLMKERSLNKTVAEALYMGIVHDTGVFKFSNTTAHTMEVAGALISYGIDFTGLIDKTFYERTYLQNQILGRLLVESDLLLDGRLIIAMLPRRLQGLYGMESSDTNGAVEQLYLTQGVAAAVLCKEMNPRMWRVSLRTGESLDAAVICGDFGGGGHVRAAGCIIKGGAEEVKQMLADDIAGRLSAW